MLVCVFVCVCVCVCMCVRVSVSVSVTASTFIYIYIYIYIYILSASLVSYCMSCVDSFYVFIYTHKCSYSITWAGTVCWVCRIQ